MQTESTDQLLLRPTAFLKKTDKCLHNGRNKTITDWIVEQLDIRPYQHILEIGYGSGNTLMEVARNLKIGFIAGIEESIDKYRQAYSKNKKMVREQLLQLHIGTIHELPYPHHYFHSIYGINRPLLHGNPGELIQLVNMLKTGGRLIMVAQPNRTTDEATMYQAAEKIKMDFTNAGLSDIQIGFRDLNPAMAISITGRKE